MGGFSTIEGGYVDRAPWLDRQIMGSIERGGGQSAVGGGVLVA